jgi:hypothetical protein
MITTDSPDEVEELRQAMNRKVQAELPAEKARARDEQTKIAQKLGREGSVHIPGIGQKIGSIDARTFFRLRQENPGCMEDPTFVRELLRDSPKLRAPGYRPPKTYRPSFVKVYP